MVYPLLQAFAYVTRSIQSFLLLGTGTWPWHLRSTEMVPLVCALSVNVQECIHTTNY